MKLTTFLIEKLNFFLLIIAIVTAAIMQFGLMRGNLFIQAVVLFSVLYLLYDYLVDFYFYRALVRGDEQVSERPKPWTQEQTLFIDVIEKMEESHREKYARLQKQKEDYEAFVELIIHEMKSPLTAMRLMSQNMEDDEGQKFRNEIHRLNGNLTTALYYCKQYDVKNDFKINPVHIKTLIKSILSEHADQFISSGISIETVNLDHCVLTDEKWFSYVVGQMLQNAFTNKEYGISNIKIELTNSGSAYSLEILDDGTGIAEHEIDRIFDKGFTGAKGRAYQNSSGLGLYLAAKICEQLGHVLRVESKEGAYTSFKIERLTGHMKGH